MRESDFVCIKPSGDITNWYQIINSKIWTLFWLLYAWLAGLTEGKGEFFYIRIQSNCFSKSKNVLSSYKNEFTNLVI